MRKIDYSKLTRAGKCKICTISLWKEANNSPTIMPCYIEGCPYMKKEMKALSAPKQVVLALAAP